MNPTQKQAEPVEVTPAITLRTAATYLERHGWTQHKYYREPMPSESRPAACALGAIGVTVHGRVCNEPEHTDLPGSADFQAAHDLLFSYLILSGEIPFGSLDSADPATIGDWNDRPEQTMQAVVEAMTAAADEWDRIHGGAA